MDQIGQLKKRIEELETQIQAKRDARLPTLDQFEEWYHMESGRKGACSDIWCYFRDNMTAAPDASNDKPNAVSDEEIEARAEKSADEAEYVRHGSLHSTYCDGFCRGFHQAQSLSAKRFPSKESLDKARFEYTGRCSDIASLHMVDWTYNYLKAQMEQE